MIGGALETVVVAGQVWELGVEEVEDEVVTERLIVAIDKPGSDEGSSLHDELDIRVDVHAFG